MATATARSTNDAPTRLWQVPAFLLGVASVLAVVFGRPYVNQLSSSSPESSLVVARAKIAAEPPDLLAAIEALRPLLAQSDAPTKLRGEAHYLTGVAMQQRLDSASADEAVELRTQTRHHLEQAEQLGVPEAEKVRLKIRLARTWLVAGDDPGQIIAALSRVADASDNPFEAYGMLAEAYGRMKTPDVAGLLEATRQQVARAPVNTDPVKLAQARLKLGELFVAARKTKEARVVLAAIGPSAPPDLAFAARKLLAQCHEDAQDWGAAAKMWEQVRDDPRLPKTHQVHVLFDLGRAYSFNAQPKEAAVAWQAAAALGGAEGQAAALKLAELRFVTDPKSAIAALSEALTAVNQPEEYRNTTVPIDELRGMFERVAGQLQTAGDFDTAGELATLYRKIAVPGRGDELRGQLATARAELLTKEGRAVPALTYWVEAAQAWIAAANATPTGPSAAYRYWSASRAAANAKDHKLALTALEKYLALDAQIPPDRLAEGVYSLATVHQNLRDFAAARLAYQKCLSMAPPWRFRARYELAQLQLSDAKDDADRGKDKARDEADRLTNNLQAKIKFDDCEKLLQDNLAELRQAVQTDSAVQEQTVYGLADVAFERGDMATAEPRLKGALQEYPESPLVVRARFRLALCHYSRARVEYDALSGGKLSDFERVRAQKQYLDLLAASQEQYAAVETALVNQPMGTLQPGDAEILRQSSFAVAELYCYSGKPADGMKAYEALAKRYAGAVEELHAIQQIWQLQFQSGQKEQALNQLTRLRDAMDKLPPAAYHGKSLVHARDYWVNKIVEMSKAH